jgi:hypothetical protein
VAVPAFPDTDVWSPVFAQLELPLQEGTHKLFLAVAVLSRSLKLLAACKPPPLQVITIFPLQITGFQFIVFIFVQLTSVSCLLDVSQVY